MKYTSLKKFFAIAALAFMCSNSFAQNLNIPTLPAGDSIIVISSVTINNPFTNVPSQLSKQHTISGTNFSTVVSNDPKTAAANDATITAVVAVTGSDLSITKTDSPDPVVAGNNLTYTITLSNLDATTPAATVSVSDVLPAGVTFVSLTTPGGWSATTPAVGGTGTVTITRASLANSDGLQTFTLVVNVDAATANGTVISNTANVTTTTTESNSANNTATATTTVSAPTSDLAIGVTDSPDPVVAGNNLTYTITLSNLDVTTAAQTVSVGDVLPTGTTFVSLSAPAGWSATTPAAGGTGTVTITKSSLTNAEGIQTFTLVVNVNSGVANGTVISNTANVTTTTGESNSANNTATATTTVTVASNASDYYRTKASGNWNSTATWESSPDNTTWSAATLTPDLNANTITILNTHTVTVTANLTTDQTTVNSGGAVIVNPNIVLTINDGTGTDIAVAGGGSFTLKSTATGAAIIGNSAGTVSGNFNVERFISSAFARSAWRLLTAPLRSTTTNATIFNTWQNSAVNTAGRGTLVTGPAYNGTNGLDATSFRPSMQWFDGTNLQPVVTTNTASTTPLFTTAASAANNSYFIFIRGDRNTAVGSAGTTTLSATGSLQSGDQTFTTNAVANQFSLIGNPYASPVDLDLFRQNNTTSNIKSTYYYWDPYISGDYGVGGYVTVSYDGTGSSYTITPASADHTRYLQSGQAMFVQTTNPAVGTAAVTFKETQKSTNNINNVFRTTSGNIEGLGINLNVLSSGTPVLLDGIVAKFDNSYSAAVDNYDAAKFYNVGESIAFIRDNKSFSIERRPLPKADDVLFLNLANLTAGRDYQFEFAPDFNAPPFTAYLKDNYLNTTTSIDVNANSKVNFTITNDAASTGANRFSIMFSKPPAVVSGNSLISIYPNPVTDGIITLQFSNMPQGNYNVRVVNNLGQTILTRQINHAAGSNTETIQLDKGVKGVYHIEVIKPDASKFSTKIIAY
ncbi:MAG: type sorting protein [Chitinophagaceae bacterium]|nr:type sorting protein [Chitinophagaceae bacterium]